MKRLFLLILSVVVLITFISNSQAQNEELITRISLTNDGSESNGRSYATSISDDGQVIVFSSDATNLIEGDTNKTYDVFVYFRAKSYTKRISVATDGTQSNDMSGGGRLSADGRYVVFVSHASNLVANDTNGESDIFVHDLQTGTTKRVSVATDGTEANHESRYPNISGDGQLIVFTSVASNLVENDNNGAVDVFVHNQQTGETSLVSVTPSGTSGSYHSDRGVISQDGRFVAFHSKANDLACCPSGFHNIFVRDMIKLKTMHISKAYDGGQTNDDSWTRDISADGRYILFSSIASNLAESDFNPYCPVGGSPNPSCEDIFVYDQKEGLLKHVSVASDGTGANKASHSPTISPNGRYVAFWSSADNLSEHDDYWGTDLFVHDLTTAQTKLVSIGYDGNQVANWIYSGTPDFTYDGQQLVFSSSASNIVENDINGELDVFVSRWQELTRIYRLHLPLVSR